MFDSRTSIEASRDAPLAPPKIRIVVADDHPVFRDGVSRLLGSERDFEVIAQASDGRAALDVLRQAEADILLLDLTMPRLDGILTLESLRAAKSKTRVIVLTASDDANQLVRAMQLGASGLVLKQTATELLIQGIRKVYQGEIWLDPHATTGVMLQMVAEGAVAAARPPADPSICDDEGSRLSVRQREIVALVVQGFKNRELAERMRISEQTVKNHLRTIFDKVGVSDRLELALYAIHNNLHTQPPQGTWVPESSGSAA